ncbi:Hypothetical predicted protein [Lecanosticta acicola]|uniref:Uncharacterized protein n=1 Tax=Lecanosticta acicola TaxID=111012 RepID=A0AAI8Z003_9PEZI|nr:Hypothetical predicted protein [Lecanosticta acicola]
MSSASDGKAVPFPDVDVDADEPPSYEVASVGTRSASDIHTNNTVTTTTTEKPARPTAALARNKTDDHLIQKVTAVSSQSSASGSSKPIIVSLERFEPAGLIRPGRVRPGGPPVSSEKDVILIHKSMTFVELEALLYKRSKIREVMPSRQSDQKSYSGVSLRTGRDKDEMWINVEDEQGWEAGRELLFTRDGSMLTYTLIVTAEDYAETEMERGNVARRAKAVRRYSMGVSNAGMQPGGPGSPGAREKKSEKCVVQ